MRWAPPESAALGATWGVVPPLSVWTPEGARLNQGVALNEIEPYGGRRLYWRAALRKLCELLEMQLSKFTMLIFNSLPSSP